MDLIDALQSVAIACLLVSIVIQGRIIRHHNNTIYHMLGAMKDQGEALSALLQTHDRKGR